MGFSFTSPLCPRPYWLDDLPVRLHKIYHKVHQVQGRVRITARARVSIRVRFRARVRFALGMS